MPAVAIQSEPLAALYIRSWGAEAQGVEGRQVLEVTRAVQRHLSEPASSFLKGDDDTTYRSVPFRKAFTVRVKYQLGGRLKPLAFPDEE
jgi:hypothetical protein